MKTFCFCSTEIGKEIEIKINANSFEEAIKIMNIHFEYYWFIEDIEIENILSKSEKIQHAIDFMSRIDPNGDFDGSTEGGLLDILDSWKNELDGATDSRGKSLLNGINKIMNELKAEV